MSELVLTLRDNPITQMMHHIWRELDPYIGNNELTVRLAVDWQTPEGSTVLEIEAEGGGTYTFQVTNADLLNVTRTATHVIETVKRRLAHDTEWSE